MPDGMSQSYAGDVTVQQAWSTLEQDPQAQLIDVRTAAEWTYVGVPDLGALGRDLLKAEWQSFPGMAIVPDFQPALGARLEELGSKPDTPLLFLCRSGVRSKAAAAAMTELGYTSCFNISGGFEGPHDDQGHRGRVGGWKAEGLPWKQG